MFRSLLLTAALTVALPSIAQASDARAAQGTREASSVRELSGRVDGQSAARKRPSNGGGSAQRKRPSNPSPASAPRGSGSSDRGGSSDRSDSTSKDQGRGGEPSRDSRPDDRPASGGAEPQRTDRPDAARPDGARPDAARPAVHGQGADHARVAPAGPRTLDTARAAAPRGEPSRALPSNFRGARPAHASPGAPHAARPHSVEVARGHRAAAAAHHHAQARHAYAHHANVDRWRHNWTRHHYGRAHWARPVTWFRPWYPGHRHVWYHGVFVYGPAPYARPVGASGEPSAPERKVNHEGQFALGVRGGSYLSGYTNGASYGDFGLGLAARYRPVEPLGLELQWNYHDDSWSDGTERIQQPLSASVQLFAFPWSKVNPYVLGGLTLTGRNVQDDIGLAQPVDTNQALWGPHGGLGLELGLSQKTSLNVDARWIGYLNRPASDPAHAGAAQLNMGLNFYF